MKLQVCSLLAAAAVASCQAVLIAQEVPAVPPVPSAEIPPELPPAQPGLPIDEPVAEPLYVPAEPVYAGPACPPGMPSPAMFPPVPMYLSQYAPQQPLCHGMVPLASSAPMCCMTPISPMTSYCPPPAAPAAAWCPPGQTVAPLDLIYTPGIVGYPFHRAPIYTNSPATRFHMHPLRKDALLHLSPGNMFPTAPISPVAKGNYYFRPYNYRQIYFDQIYAAAASGNPEAPYSAPLLPHLANRLDTYKQSLDRALLPALAPQRTPAAAPTMSPTR